MCKKITNLKSGRPNQRYDGNRIEMTGSLERRASPNRTCAKRVVALAAGDRKQNGKLGISLHQNTRSLDSFFVQGHKQLPNGEELIRIGDVQSVADVVWPDTGDSNLSSTEESKLLGDVVDAFEIRLKKGNIRSFEDEYSLNYENPLGRGAFGTVRLCKHLDTDRVYAVKVIPLATRTNIPRVEKEIKIFELCKGHDNFVNLVDTFLDKDFAYIVMDWIQQKKARQNWRGWYSEAQTKFILRGVCRALRWLHANNICHGDVKLDNVLLDTDCVKLIDFDLAYISPYDIAVPQMVGTRGTLEYYAPEIIHSYFQVTKYNHKIDVWSSGVMMYRMLRSKHPFSARCSQEECLRRNGARMCDKCLVSLDENIRSKPLSLRGPRWMTVSYEAKDLLRKFLTVDPESRPDMEEVLSHPWFQTNEVPKWTRCFGAVSRVWRRCCTVTMYESTS